MSKKIANPEALKALRDKARADLGARTGAGETAVTVHMGTCGIAAGARNVLASLMDALSDAAAEAVLVKQSGCLGLCDKEPMMTVADAAGQSCIYGHLTDAKVREIVQGHLLGGRPVVEHLIQSEGGAKKHGQR